MAEYLKKIINYALCVFLLFEVPLKHLALKKTINKPTNNIKLLCQQIFFMKLYKTKKFA